MSMDDLIKRQAAIDALNCNVQIRGEENAEAVKKMLSMFFENIMAIPSAQRTGKWIPTEIMVHNYYAITGFKCSVCGEDALDDDAEPMTDYCPHCGARMVEHGRFD